MADEHAAAFLDGLLRGTARDAEDAVRAALGSGLERSEVHVLVIAPAMRTIGELWARDEITVGDEHLATAIVGLQMVSDSLTAAGCDVMFLGADVPLDALVAAIARSAPAVVACR